MGGVELRNRGPRAYNRRMTTSNGITVTLRLFAVYRERVGGDCIEVTLPSGATVEDALRRLAESHPVTAPLLATTMVAVNQSYVERSEPLRAGDEVALIPPVSGGLDYPSPDPRILITDAPLDAERVTAMVSNTANGGVVTFQGVTRDETGGRSVVRLDYEAYPEMAYKTLQQIFGEVEERWGIADLALAHRIGRLELGEASLVVAVGAAHRAEAFAAAMYVVDRLKEIVPIWKKEHFQDGSVWVALGSSAPPEGWTGTET